jgi:hypothetical protein
MAIYSGKDMPNEVGRTTMDPEVKSWLKDGPVLGSHEPIHVQRAAHDRFIDTNKPRSGLRDFAAKRSKRRAPPRNALKAT